MQVTMKQKNINPFVGLSLATTFFLMGCGSTQLVSTPMENIDTMPLKVSELTDAQKKTWSFADLATDTIPGMSVDKAYKELVGNKTGKKIIVAVLDSGIDLKQEDLANLLWTNTDEIPGNGKDDDNNGYVDDIHGYNFLGDSYDEELECARMVRLNIGTPTELAAAKAEVEKKRNEAMENKQRYEQMLQAVTNADADVKKALGKDEYKKEDLATIKTQDENLQRSISILMQMYNYEDSIPEVLTQLKDGVDHFAESLNYNLNLEFDGRKSVGDDPYDITDTGYGNGNPQATGKDEIHGTHVAGIIAAQRGNGKGMDGVANNVALMSVRAVPNGDEYDKDIALGIRYAVDNGAKIINCSFGKPFSPKRQWVYDAIKYAASKDVLIVHAAGNDGNDLDDPANPNFPNDQIDNGPEMADNVITVGALTSKYGSEMVASFSNYGHVNVDVFAPGAKIYSTVPDNEYEFLSGTSMASPAVAGVAALVWSQYPDLKASQVKHIIMKSGLAVKTPVILSGDPAKTGTLANASTTGTIVNAYNALILANQVSNGKAKL